MDDVRISVEATEGLVRRIRIQVPAAHVERAFEDRLKSAGSTVNLKGFRPGKVPASVMRQRFGSQVRQDLIRDMVQANLADAMAREKFRPVGEPQIELKADPAVEGSDLDFTASFEVFPEFQVQGLADLAINRLELAIDDADVDFVIDSLRRQRAAATGNPEKLPEVDEHFIRSFDVASGSRDEFIRLVRDYMREEFESRARADMQRQLLDFLLARNPVSVPPGLLDRELAALQADAARTGAALPDRAAAERRIRVALVTAAIVRDHGLQPDPARVKARVEEVAAGEANPAEARNRIQQTPALLDAIEREVLDEQLVDWLVMKARVTPVPTHFRALKQG